jgi:hypothetical protein
MTTTYADNKFGDIELSNGSFIRLTQHAYSDNNASGDACYKASGYLSTENEENETGPTVKVIGILWARMNRKMTQIGITHLAHHITVSVNLTSPNPPLPASAG